MNQLNLIWLALDKVVAYRITNGRNVRAAGVGLKPVNSAIPSADTTVGSIQPKLARDDVSDGCVTNEHLVTR